MSQPDAPPVKAQTQNKSMGAGVGGVAGGGIGALFVTYLDFHYHITLTGEQAALIGSFASTIAAWVGAFFMPLVTAAQNAALRKLESEK